MISIDHNLFHIQTKSTSYVFRVEPAGHLEHLHYAARVHLSPMAEDALKQKHSSLPSATICYSEETPCLSMELLRGEISSLGKGDYGEPFLELSFPNGAQTCDFLYRHHEILSRKPMPSGLPGALPPKGSPEETLVITLEERSHPGLLLHLYYTAYEDCDVILRSARLENRTPEHITIKRFFSSQLDFEDNDYVFTNFYGSWTSEMHRADTPCPGKKCVSESRIGFSSNRANPFVMLSRPGCTETAGEVYGSNLIYSGNHYECAQSGELERLRFMTGISPEGFSWDLAPGAVFQAPEAVLSYSANGFSSLSKHFHKFIRSYIVRGTWAQKPRPILFNTWEAAYFNFNEDRILTMARQAKDLGAELLVLDDGWFGKRNSTKTSMGDWFCNPEKLPHGVDGLARRVHELGLQFGIWVEPEVISVDSDLYRAHPEWSLSIPGCHHSLGRNTHLLDLSNPEVVDYLFDVLSKIFAQGVDYVKWDMNRGMSDVFSTARDAAHMCETGHRFLLGLYDLLTRLTTRFPNILFESCASGGNRADLGILCYMPQFWASDNSDALCRMQIQTNYTYGYPLSVLGCHVSAVPNHQTMRETPVSTRYEVAAFGLLGYELDPGKLSEDDLTDIAQQIAHYKQLREWSFFGEVDRLQTGDRGYYSLQLTSPDGEHAAVVTFQEIYRSGRPMYVLRARGLQSEAMYEVRNRPCMMNVKPISGRFITIASATGYTRMPRETEHYFLPGDLIAESGIRLKSDFNGHNLDENTRYYPDYATRMYEFMLVK